MPFIRDFQVAYETVTTDAGLTIPMCEHATGDLLVVYVCSDTGTPTWTPPTGWTQLYARTTSAAFYKKAASASEADPVVGSTVSETYSGLVTAWGDAYADGAPVYTETTASGVRVAMPQPATARDNSIIMYVMSSTGNNAGMFGVESDMNQLAISDGSAEGVGAAWALEKVATGTSTARFMIAPVSVSHKGSIVIAAPVAGATVIPNHITSEGSTILDSNVSTVAYDGNTAIAATADTHFGTSINSKTCNDATVAVTADIGLDVNSYHGMMGITNAATANQMSGAAIVLAAARYSIGADTNILTAVRRATPNAIQTATTIASGRGVWMGLHSGTTGGSNWKVWQVYSKDVPQDFGVAVPIIINPSNTDTLATNGTLDTADTRQIGVWRGGVGVLTGKDCFGMFWKMGTTVVSSGTYTMDMPALKRLLATDKERLAVIQQGANQYIVYQKVQFGDGTNPINFQVDSVAIEFPSKKNTAAGLINFNGTDNSLGFIFYPSSTGTIKLINSIISGGSKQAFQVHASASASATWDFKGSTIIGMGDVQLRAVWTWTQVTFTNCLTITQNSAVIDGCTFSNSKIISASPADAALISDTSFTSAGTGYAIEIGGTATNITLSGLTFTGYATTDGSTGNEAVFVNIASGNMTINVSGGTTPSIRTAGATINVVRYVTVKVTAKDADSLAAIQDARVLLEADAGGDLPAAASVTITSSGTTASVAHTDHGMSTGMSVIIRGANEDEYNGIFTISNVTTNAYDYTMSADPAGSSATGTITATCAILNGVTGDGDPDPAGILQTTTFNYTSDQPIAGKVRRASTGTKYKTGAITGTITSTGLDTTVLLIADE